MPNTIALAKNYADLLDEIYKLSSITADLTGDSAMMRHTYTSKLLAHGAAPKDVQ